MINPRLPLRVLAASLALVVTTSAVAQQVYRSIDAAGNVTFSSLPPPPNEAARVETIQLPPGPTAEQQAAAAARMQQIQSDTERRAADRAARQAQQGSDQQGARQALQQAEQALEQARVRGDGDWQTLASGGRVPSAAYEQRVREAEARVQAARSALNQSRR